ncbi:MAG: secondary thiamine-phosphate synthase enzyme YjbQ [Phycisphaerales bacterium]
MVREISLRTPGRGLHACTDAVAAVVDHAGVESGLCTVFIRHTSASLLIQENADPSARHDLETWLDRFVPDGTGWTHTAEGPDDMPGHIRAALTATSLSIPVLSGRLGLGTWQGVYLWEHRRAPHTRRLLVHVGGDRP